MRAANNTPDDESCPEGVTLILKSQILILDGQTFARTLDTYLHEIGHYFFDASGIEECFSGMVKAGAKDTWEEQFIRLVTPWVLHFAEANTKPFQLFNLDSEAV